MYVFSRKRKEEKEKQRKLEQKFINRIDTSKMNINELQLLFAKENKEK